MPLNTNETTVYYLTLQCCLFGCHIIGIRRRRIRSTSTKRFPVKLEKEFKIVSIALNHQTDMQNSNHLAEKLLKEFFSDPDTQLH